MIPLDIAYDIHQNHHKDLIRIAERERNARKALSGEPAQQSYPKRAFNWNGAGWNERDLALQPTSVQGHPSKPSCAVLESAGYYESCRR